MTEPSPEAPQATTPAVEASIIGGLRQSRSKIGAGSKPLYLDVPGYDGKLVLRFKWIPFRELSSTSRSLSQITELTTQAVAAAADTVGLTCEEVCVRVPGADHTPEYPKGIAPLSTNGEPVSFTDERLAYALDFTAPDNQRDMVVRAYNNEYALIDQAAAVVEWLKDTSRKVDETFLGE